MAYGIRMYTAGGLVRLDHVDLITRYLDRRVVGRHESGSYTVPGFDASRGFVFIQRAPGENFLRAVHSVTISGDQVDYYPTVGEYYEPDSSPPEEWDDRFGGAGRASSIIIVGMYQ